MEALDYIEQQGQRSAAFSLETVELMNKRAQALLTLLMGGAGATGSYALAHIGEPNSRWVVFCLGAVSVWWFFLAAYVTWRGLASRKIRAPAGWPQMLLDQLKGPLTRYVAEVGRQQEGDPHPIIPDALTLLREGEIKVLQETIKNYQTNSTEVACALNHVYLAVAASPFGAIFGAVIALLSR